MSLWVRVWVHVGRLHATARRGRSGKWDSEINSRSGSGRRAACAGMEETAPEQGRCR
jgi:hypothetical protein